MKTVNGNCTNIGPAHTEARLTIRVRGHAHLAFSKTENLTSEGYFSYVKDFKGGHNLNATAGYSYFEVNGENGVG